jgi:hypothetical protein
MKLLSLSLCVLCLICIAGLYSVHAENYCTVKSTPCGAGYREVFDVSQPKTDWGHAGLNKSDTYKVCCLDLQYPDNYCWYNHPWNYRYLYFSNLTNAHVRLTDYPFEAPYDNPGDNYALCVKSTAYVYIPGDKKCDDNFTTQGPPPYNNIQCLISVMRSTNSHVRDCNSAGLDGNYTKICLIDTEEKCELWNVSISPMGCTSGCAVGDTVNMTFYYDGVCRGGNIARTAFVTEVASNDSSCKISYWNTADIRGMDQGFAPQASLDLPGGGSFITGQANWTIPSIPSACTNKTVYPRRAYILTWNLTSINPTIQSEVANPDYLFGNFTFADVGISMKCGNVSIHGVNAFNKTCNTTAPITPNIACYPDGCTINETATLASCYHFGDTFNNSLGENISCSYNNTWCPTHFFFNASTNYCEMNLSSTCDEGFYPNRALPNPSYNLTCFNISSIISNPLQCLWNATLQRNSLPPFRQSCCNIQKWDEYYFCQQAEVTVY